MIQEQNNHPASLKVFFATEMWERYGFYVVQTLLALYLVLHFQWDDNRVYFLVGAFTALTYLSPLVGGCIADHLLGQKRSILLGAIILMISYLILGFITTDQGLDFSLAGIAVGTGLLKPNISSLLGNEYDIGAPNRERGFTIFYMGITTGIILGTTLPSYIQSQWGWSAAFLSATIGMIIAGVVFIYGVHCFRIKDYSAYQYSLKKIYAAGSFILVLWLGSYFTLQSNKLAEILFAFIAFFCIFYLVMTIRKETYTQAKKTIIIGLLCLISVAFWAFYFQMFHSLTLLLKRLVDPNLFALPFPPPYYVAIQSIGMIVFGLFLGIRKKQSTLAQKTRQIGNKFLLAIFFITLAYGLIVFICYFSHSNVLLSPLYFIPAYLMISIAELLLSPVGLSAITLLSSPKRVSTMMGIFFVSLGLGGFLSGKLANLTALTQQELLNPSIAELKHHYALTFAQQFYILLGTLIVCFILNQLIRYLGQGQAFKA